MEIAARVKQTTQILEELSLLLNENMDKCQSRRVQLLCFELRRRFGRFVENIHQET
jgi:hypothetical protein